MRAETRIALRDARVGIVLGSGAGDLAVRLARPRRTSYAALAGFPRVRVPGHAGELVVGELAGVAVAVLAGRAHVYEGHPMAKVVAGVRALARSGIRAVILTNAAGGIRRSLRPGDLMLVTDHINGFGTSPRAVAGAPRFTDMTEVYDRELREIARSAARRLRLRLRQGIYAGVPGPAYETPAEIRMWARLGADAIGMSTVPEAIALRQADVRILAISTITNMGAGIGTEIGAAPLTHGEVLARGRSASSRLGDLLEAIVPEMDALFRAGLPRSRGRSPLRRRNGRQAGGPGPRSAKKPS